MVDTGSSSSSRSMAGTDFLADIFAFTERVSFVEMGDSGARDLYEVGLPSVIGEPLFLGDTSRFQK